MPLLTLSHFATKCFRRRSSLQYISISKKSLSAPELSPSLNKHNGVVTEFLNLHSLFTGSSYIEENFSRNASFERCWIIDERRWCSLFTSMSLRFTVNMYFKRWMAAFEHEMQCFAFNSVVFRFVTVTGILVRPSLIHIYNILSITLNIVIDRTELFRTYCSLIRWRVLLLKGHSCQMSLYVPSSTR